MARGGPPNRGRGSGQPPRGRGRGRGRGRDHNEHFNAVSSFSNSNNHEPEIGEMNAHLSERIRGTRPSVDSDQASDGNTAIKLNPDIARYFRQQEDIVNSSSAAEWQKMPEVPDNLEISLKEEGEVELPANRWQKPWKSVEKYLKTHFGLLREDAISPLRDAVDSFKRDPEMMDDQHAAIYEKVRIIGFLFSRSGIAARIQFSTRRAQRNILWQGSKRLVSGGIVALSPVGDNFATKCIVAVVAARPLEGLAQNPPEIDLFFIRSEDIEFDSRLEWVMIEARTGYFEAYRHTLRALQKLGKESFPLSEYICSLSQSIEPPKYLQDNSVIDLSSAGRPDSATGYGQVDVINNWPLPVESSLDNTQWDGLRQILTKSLAVVQGPPGTGKTFVSTVALEILNRNTKPGDPPIIIAAQTNHALDQLLEHVSRFEPQYIRLGGRSTSLEVKQHALYEVRKKERINLIPGSSLGKAISTHHMQSKAMVEILKPFHQGQSSAIPPDAFVKYNVISERQAESIVAGSARWINSSMEEVRPMDMWLSGALYQYPVDQESNDFGFKIEEDEDLEVEQLREQEAEHGVNDEEDAQDILQGLWCSVNQRMGVATPSDTEENEAANALNSRVNLWDIPERRRGNVYHVMVQRLKDAVLKKFRIQADLYSRNLKDLNIGKWERDAVFLQRAKIIGLTTTGLSKYRPLIASLKPKIILIEEAAEVLEAPVTVACMESVEHLILVGDHEQLQGHCSVDELAGSPYYLNMSMFERLVRKDMPYTTLLSQRRMHPDFRALLSPIYPRLRDHPSVLARPTRDWGMGEVRGYFFDHEWYESRDAQMSTYNEQEATFVAGFYRYLVLNGTPPSEITLLTLYNGHRKRLLKEIRKYPELAQVYNNVKTVDSYQGEENTIILLCLARHNSENKIGFLENRNRVCVALSRAREGFYIFGSTTVLAKDPLWMSVVANMHARGRLGRSMPVICKQHGKRMLVENPQDWQETLGGCKEKCLQVLTCGHVCAFSCHPFSHETVSCARLCEKQLPCGHNCQQRCYETCSCKCGYFPESLPEQPPRITYGASDARFEGKESLRDGGPPEDLGTPIAVDLPTVGQAYLNGRYLSGRYSLTDEHHMYLQHQDSRSMNQVPMREAGGTVMHSPTMWNLGSIQESDGDVADRHSSSSSPFATSRFPEAEQQRGLRNWSGFAGGTVRDDDFRRSLASTSTSIKPVSRNRQKGPQAKEIHSQSNGVRNQRSHAMKDGRQKFTEEYVPAAFRAATKSVEKPEDVLTDSGNWEGQYRSKEPKTSKPSHELSIDENGAGLGLLIDFE